MLLLYQEALIIAVVVGDGIVVGRHSTTGRRRLRIGGGG